VVVAAGLGLVAGYFGSFWIYLDFFAHFRVHFSMALGVSVLAFLFSLWRSFVLFFGLAVIPLLIGLQSPGWRYFSNDPSLAASGHRAVSVLSFNNMLINRNSRMLERYIRRKQADIVVLIEIGSSKKPLLRRLKKLYPYQKHCAGVKKCHIAVLSKYRFVAGGLQTFNPGSPPYVWVRLGPKMSGLTVVATHLIRPPYLKLQLGHVNGLSGFVRNIKGPVIVAGDFNLTPWSYLFRKFARQGKLTAVTGVSPTWPVWFANLAQFPIDHMFVTPGIKTRLITTGVRLGSDHLPIFGVFTLPR
jgi:endonuclease/exonuclease/phosphatase (EEP) superfamily protein YafD